MNSSPASDNSVTHAPRALDLVGTLMAIYVFLLPFLFNIGDRMNFAPADVFLVMAILVGSGQMRFRPRAWSAWHVGIMLTLALGSLVAALKYGRLDRYELLNKDAGLLLPFLSYFAVTSTVTNWDALRRIIRVFTFSVVAQNIVAMGGFVAAYYWGVTTRFTKYEGLRLSGMLLDPNAYGSLLVVAFVLCEGSSWGRDPVFKPFARWVCRLTLGLGIVFTFSRSAWGGLGLAFLVLILVRPGVAVRTLLFGLFAAPLLILLLGERFIPIFENMARRPEQVRQRIDLIHQAFGSFVLHPLLGGGLGSFRLTAGEVAHNSALWFLADFGLAGLTIFIGFLVWFARKSWLAYRFAAHSQRPVALALLLAHTAMMGVAMGIEAFYQRHWWMILALIASCYSLTRRSFDTGHANMFSGCQGS